MRIFLLAAVAAVMLGNVGCQMVDYDRQHAKAMRSISPELKTMNYTEGERRNNQEYWRDINERGFWTDIDMVTMTDRPTTLSQYPVPRR